MEPGDKVMFIQPTYTVYDEDGHEMYSTLKPGEVYTVMNTGLFTLTLEEVEGSFLKDNFRNVPVSIIIEKVRDNIFGGNHPYGVNEGYRKQIYARDIPTPYVGSVYTFGSLRTSPVVRIHTETKDLVEFDTMNSSYKVYRDDSVQD